MVNIAEFFHDSYQQGLRKLSQLQSETYEEAIEKSNTVLDIMQNLYNILKNKTVDNEDAETFELFINDLKSHYCI